MKRETFQKQATIALAALAQHMHDHDLSAPRDIDLNPVDQVIRIRVNDEAAQLAWLTTLVIEGEENEAFMGPIWIKTIWKVRLPDLGIGFELRGLRRQPMSATAPALKLVSA